MPASSSLFASGVGASGVGETQQRGHHPAPAPIKPVRAHTDWLGQDGVGGGGPGVSTSLGNPIERQALLDLYYSTSGSSWSINKGWATPTDYCQPWVGLECDPTTGSVTTMYHLAVFVLGFVL